MNVSPNNQFREGLMCSATINKINVIQVWVKMYEEERAMDPASYKKGKYFITLITY